MPNNRDIQACWNNEPDFDFSIEQSLGFYVYALRDPSTKKPFYIGKGGATAQAIKGYLIIFGKLKSIGKEKRLIHLQKLLKFWKSGMPESRWTGASFAGASQMKKPPSILRPR